MSKDHIYLAGQQIFIAYLTKRPGTFLCSLAVAVRPNACPGTSLPAAPFQRELVSGAKSGRQTGSTPSEKC